MLSVVMLSVIMLSVIMLSVVMLSVVMLSMQEVCRTKFTLYHNKLKCLSLSVTSIIL